MLQESDGAELARLDKRSGDLQPSQAVVVVAKITSHRRLVVSGLRPHFSLIAVGRAGTPLGGRSCPRGGRRPRFHAVKMIEIAAAERVRDFLPQASGAGPFHHRRESGACRHSHRSQDDPIGDRAMRLSCRHRCPFCHPGMRPPRPPPRMERHARGAEASTGKLSTGAPFCPYECSSAPGRRRREQGGTRRR